MIYQHTGSKMSDLIINIKPPVRHDNAFSVHVWRFGKLETNGIFQTEAKARAYLRRCGYPSSKTQVALSA
jgi:hypothetical protein